MILSWHARWRVMRRVVRRAWLMAIVAAVCAGCALQTPSAPNPLQSPVRTATPTASPTQDLRARAPSAQTTPALNGTPTVTATVTATPTLALGYRGTSQAVILTITAQYFTPTPQPTPTRRPNGGSNGGGKAGTGDSSGLPSSTTIANNETAIISLSERVPVGGTVSLAIRTQPGALCTVSRADGDTLAPISGVPARLAGSDGTAAWLWPLAAPQSAGELRLRVDCGEGRTLTATVKIER